ncbi:MAG: YunG family protein [Geminicoccaceae bacterium]
MLAVLQQAWSIDSARQWRPENPAAGQCNVTALLLNELYGGMILKTPLTDGLHFYNSIAGKRVDLTASQFDQPIDYADLPSSREEAEQDIARAEYSALKSAYLRLLQPDTQMQNS